MNKVKFVLLSAGILLALGFVFSCSSSSNSSSSNSSSSKDVEEEPKVTCDNTPPSVIYGTPVTYGGKTYETVVIGNQTWFKSDLGGKYNLEKAKVICPEGWRLPSHKDWDELKSYVDGYSGCGRNNVCISRHLRATSGWGENREPDACGYYYFGGGTDAYGFSALPNDYSWGYGGACQWWYRDSKGYQWYQISDRDFGGIQYAQDADKKKEHFFGVRCLKDSSSSSAVLKECDAIFNPDNKFCYDGTVYDKCGGKIYNPPTQGCVSGKIVETKCGNSFYDQQSDFCYDGTVYRKCDGKIYYPLTQGCDRYEIKEKCGSVLYDQKTRFCYEGVVYDKCDGMVYPPATHICQNRVAVPAKCGEESYNPLTQRCNGGIVETKCGTNWYDASDPNFSCQSSSSAVVSSSSAVVFSSSSAERNDFCNYGPYKGDGDGGCYGMPTDDNCISGTIVSTCPPGTKPPWAEW